jgi:hypothetical protein
MLYLLEVLMKKTVLLSMCLILGATMVFASGRQSGAQAGQAAGNVSINFYTANDEAAFA